MKILASDFDNTIFYSDNKKQNKKNIESIKKFVAFGNIFCIITGRNYTDLKRILTENNIPYSYLLCEDGAKIFNNMDYCLDTVLLPEDVIEKLVTYLKEKKYDFYLDDGYNKTEYYGDCVKIVINCKESDNKDKIVKELEKIVSANIYASRTHINIIHKSVNKKNAIKKLFNMENLDYDLLYVIGDNDNDYEMLKDFPGAVIKEHHKVLDELNKTEYDNISDYIEELLKEEK